MCPLSCGIDHLNQKLQGDMATSFFTARLKTNSEVELMKW